MLARSLPLFPSLIVMWAVPLSGRSRESCIKAFFQIELCYLLVIRRVRNVERCFGCHVASLMSPTCQGFHIMLISYKLNPPSVLLR